MSESHTSLSLHRNLVVVVFMALLAACVPNTMRVASTPASFAATAAVAAINLTWGASAGATSYNVKRGTTSGGPYTQLASTSGTTYRDTSVVNGTMYYYVVTSVAADGESTPTGEIAATPVVQPLAPATVLARAGDRQITLSWSASTNAATYNVKRSLTRGGPYTQIASPTGTTYVDTGLINATAYFYVITAVNVAGESPNSRQVTAVPDVQNPPPTVFGTWTNVTPAGVDLTTPLCSNYGTTNVQADPAHPSNVYVQFHCQGIWKSTDYGQTWTGPINTGTNGALAGDCSGGITIPPRSVAAVPLIYQTCIRGGAIGFWRSVDGGVSWNRYDVPQVPGRQDYYGPAVDPYDQNHLLMTGHEFDAYVESFDGGLTWTTFNTLAGMRGGFGRSGWISFIDRGNAVDTRGTWLYTGDFGGGQGTWRTIDSGATWEQVDSMEHVGNTQIYQPDAGGVVYMAGINSANGNGVLRSRDYGASWSHVGLDKIQSVVLGTSKNLYSLYGYPVGPGGTADPDFQLGAQPGTGTWVAPGAPTTPATLKQGSAQLITINDGTHNILLSAMWNAGIWRYVEP